MKNKAENSILFMKASYDLSFSKIWGATHGHLRNSWWFDMESLFYIQTYTYMHPAFKYLPLELLFQICAHFCLFCLSMVILLNTWS